MYSPAFPRITPDEYKQILETLVEHANPENARVRREIAGYLEARDIWHADARKRGLTNPF